MRKFLAILLTALLLCSGGAAADVAQIGDNNFVVGVRSKDFVHFAAPEGRGRQQMENWCWAACIQMVLNFHGVYVKQEDVVKRVFGTTVDRPANGNEILAALSGWAPDYRERRSAIYADPIHVDARTVVTDLQRDWPLIVGLSNPAGQPGGHAYVLTGAYYYLDPYQNPVIYRVILRDPYPSQPSRVEMPMPAFLPRLKFATRVYVERL